MKLPIWVTIWRIHQGTPEEQIRIEVVDKASDETIVDFCLTAEQYANLFKKSTTFQEAECETGELHRIGKKRESARITFPMPLCDPSQKEAIARDVANMLCPKGWKPLDFFGAADSFFEANGNMHARASIVRWVSDAEKSETSVC